MATNGHACRYTPLTGDAMVKQPVQKQPRAKNQHVTKVIFVIFIPFFFYLSLSRFRAADFSRDARSKTEED